MFNKLIAVSLCSLSVNCLAGELIRDATITEVTNNSSNGADFSIRTEGGTGVCIGELIAFPEAKSQSQASTNQAFSIALAAFISKKKIRAHNYDDNGCRGASFIAITD